MTTVLFIGGSIDGQRREVDAHVDRVQVPKDIPLGAYLDDDGTPDWEPIRTVDHYRRVYLPTHAGPRGSFMLHASIGPEDAMRLLLEGYRKP